ncbi:MAG TPA: hypothetical protein VM890_14295 [Longimicrobium sp.]|nr:hypothetical protein [Longimicrobium sp.]
MLKISKFRLATLAAIAVSVFQLNTAKAAPVPTAWDQCDEEALGVLVGACDYYLPDWDYGEIWYYCTEDGHLGDFYGECVDYE